MNETGQEFDINNLSLDDVQESKDYAPVKAGIYQTKVESIEATTRKLQSGEVANIISLRHSIVGEAETVGPGEVGGVFNTLYLHKKEALGFLRRFIEAHGVTWEDFKANRDLQQFMGAEAQTQITLEKGNDGIQRNRVGKYVVEKVNS